MIVESSPAVLIFAFVAGMALGLAYFIILWASLQRLPSSRTPFRLMIFSYIARLFLVLPGFYLVMNHRWERVASALAGFIIMRSILTRLLVGREHLVGECRGNTPAQPDKP
ncbi:MAG TPA: ATP synthase subunit I [Deltaproteobacteria bacterium]|nr:ATP synthase subunit I [Deltaproteobacteria bacterium]